MNEREIAKNLLLDHSCESCKSKVIVIDQTTFNSFIKCSNMNRLLITEHFTKIDLSSAIKCDERGTCEHWRNS